MSDVKRYKTPILALESEPISAGGGLFAVVKASDYDDLHAQLAQAREHAENCEITHRIQETTIAELQQDLARLRQEREARMFPIQLGWSRHPVKPHPTRIPWSIAELAYSVYANRYGTSQSLERLAERGGFGPGEMDMFLPDWRERCSEVESLKQEHATLRHNAGKFFDERTRLHQEIETLRQRVGELSEVNGKLRQELRELEVEYANLAKTIDDVAR